MPEAGHRRSVQEVRARLLTETPLLVSPLTGRIDGPQAPHAPSRSARLVARLKSFALGE